MVLGLGLVLLVLVVVVELCWRGLEVGGREGGEVHLW